MSGTQRGLVDTGPPNPASLATRTSPRVAMAAVAAVVDTDDFLLQASRRGKGWADLQVDAAEAAIAEVLREHTGTDWRYVPPDQWVITFLAPPSEPVYEQALACLHRVRAEVRRATGLTTSVGISRPREGADGVALAIRQAEYVAMNKLVRGGNRILEEEVPVDSAGSPPRIDRRLAQRIRAGDRYGVARLVTEWIEECARQPGVTAEQLQEWILGKLLFIMDIVSPSRLGNGSADWLRPRAILLRDLVQVVEIHERSYLQMWVHDALDQLLPPAPRSVVAGASVIQKAEHYIEQNFSDPDLHLDKLAGELSVSPYHLAHLFRRERNSTFLRALTGQRMRAARHLLATTDFAVQRVAEMTGHSSAKRFRLVFKREVGCNPSDYRASESE